MKSRRTRRRKFKFNFPLAVTLTITAIAAFSFGLGAYVSHASVTLNGSGVTASSTSGNFLELTSSTNTLFSVNNSGNVGANEFYGSTVSTTPVPNLSFTSAGGLNLNAGGTNQDINLSPTGSGATIATNLEDKGGQVFNVKAYGAVGNGTTDDTAAIQNLLNQFSARINTSCSAGKIMFPAGVYVIKQTLYYFGNNNCSLRITGSSMGSRNDEGATLRWAGPSGDPMLIIMGGNEVGVDHLTFDTGGTASTGMVVTADNAYNGEITQAITTPGTQTVTVSSLANIEAGTWLGITDGANSEIIKVIGTGSGTITADFTKTHPMDVTFGGPGSSGVSFADDTVINLGSGNVGITMGNYTSLGTPQISENVFRNVYIVGTACAAGIKWVSSGNTKNVSIYDSAVNGCVDGYILSGSGRQNIIGGGFGAITGTDIQFPRYANVLVEGTESEDIEGATFVSDGGGGSSAVGQVTLINNEWQTAPPASGYVVYANANLTMIGNYFGNATNGGYVAKVDMGSPSGIVSIFSEGNEFANATGTYAPLYVSNDAAFPGWYNGKIQLHVVSMGDVGYTAGNVNTLFTDFGPTSATASNITTVAGTTAGDLYWSEPAIGNAGKKVILNFQGYENSTTTAQTVTFPEAFDYSPASLGDCPAGISLGASIATLPTSMSTPFTGQCIIEGQ